MDPEPRYIANSGAVAAKIIEGEAIVINVTTGRYYSFEAASAVAWVHLASGAPLDDAAAAIAARYDVAADMARADLQRLAGELVAAELVVAAPAGAAPAAGEDLEALEAVPATPAPYPGLELLTFDDMEDLLAFDPPLPAAEVPDGRWSPG